MDGPVDGPVVERVTSVDDRLRSEMLRCWVAVTNAGGAVGFLPPVTPTDVAPALDAAIEEVRAGRRTLVTVRDVDGFGGFGFLERQRGPVVAHRATVKALQTHPERRGRGLGGALLAGIHRHAAADGIEIVMLFYRGGLGLGGFYRRLGYVEVGRLRGSLRVGDDDRRDDVWMATWLDPESPDTAAHTSLP